MNASWARAVSTTRRRSRRRWTRRGPGWRCSWRRSSRTRWSTCCRERELLLDGVGVPDVRTEIDGRQVLIVVRGYHYKEDLATLRPYIREYRPVLIGVDGGADAILDAGLPARPHRR